MSNKKRAMNRANLILERRFLNENTNQLSDNDGNLWYVGNIPNSDKFKIYVKLKDSEQGIHPIELETKNPELWKKVSGFKSYLDKAYSESEARYYLNFVLGKLKEGPDGGDLLNRTLTDMFRSTGIVR
jgi:hypothetical protein